MKIAPFATEQFYARYEFNTPYQLCNSDCETLSIEELLHMAGMSLSELGQLKVGYTETQGDPLLREAIAALHSTVASDAVVVLGTPIEGIYLAARTLLEPGDEVVVLTPAYDALINMFEHVVGAGNIKKWAFTATGDRWQLDLDHLRGLITPKTRLLVVNFPHNPTGYLPSQGYLDELLALVGKHELRLFADEMFFGLIHSGTPATPSIADQSQRAVVLSGLSKTYGLPGLRTGWLIIQDEGLRNDLMNWKFYTSICPPAPSEFLAKAALKVKKQLRERSIATVEHNLELAAAFFDRWPDLFVWRPPQASCTALVQVNVPSVTALSKRLAEKAGVLIHPGTTLGSDDRHMRLGLGRAAFGVALEKFEDYLTANKGTL